MNTWTLDDNGTNTIDTRDIEARIDELESNIEDMLEDQEHGRSFDNLAYEDMRDELATLRDFRDECGAVDWLHGETLIKDDYFEEYAQDLAEELGMVASGASWPSYCIDWECAARALQHDYSCAELDGVMYWWQS